MQRKKILWLASWYPNKNDPFDGDFIQRHARAAAIGNDVHVIHVTEATGAEGRGEEWNYVTGLTEQTIYIRKRQGWTGKLAKQLSWRKSFQQAIKNYIASNGMPDRIHVHVPWKSGLMALWMKRKYGRDYIVTEHWGMYNRVVENNFYTQPKLVRTLLRRIFREASAFVPVSVYLSRQVEMITGKKADMIIPNVVDTTLFFYKGEKYSKFTYIHVSNMVPLKNVGAILDAVKQLSEKPEAAIQLILVGNRNDQYVRYADQLGLLNTFVYFRGEIPYGEVAAEMQRSHCLILNSVMENSPCVIGEALCCGLPVIATSVGGVPELVSETNGRLIAPRDTSVLAAAMEEVFSSYARFDPKEIAREAAGKFGYSTIAGQFDELYHTRE